MLGRGACHQRGIALQFDRGMRHFGGGIANIGNDAPHLSGGIVELPRQPGSLIGTHRGHANIEVALLQTGIRFMQLAKQPGKRET